QPHRAGRGDPPRRAGVDPVGERVRVAGALRLRGFCAARSGPRGERRGAGPGVATATAAPGGLAAGLRHRHRLRRADRGVVGIAGGVGDRGTYRVGELAQYETVLRADLLTGYLGVFGVAE